MSLRRIFITLALILTLSVETKAETRYLSSRNGLSNSSVTCIYKDSEDYVWFGTWDGLNRYDGSEFEIFRSSLDERSLSSSIIRQVLEDNSCNLWVATDRGIDRFSRKDNSFTRYFSEIARKGMFSEHSFFLAKDNDGNLFAAVSGHGLFKFSPEEDRFVTIFKTTKTLSGLWCDGNAGIWARSEDCLYKISESVDGTHFPIKTSADLHIDFASLGANNGTMWIGESNNNILKEINLQTGAICTELAIPKSTKRITCLDDTGESILVGTDNGLLEYSDGKPTTLQPDIPVLSLSRDESGIIWVGTDMLGVAVISNAETPFHAISGKQHAIFANSAVRAFYEEMPGRMWIGTKGNGLVLMNLYNGTELRRYDTGNGLNDNNVYSLYEGDEVIWIGTDGKGLNYIEKSSGNIFNLAIPESITLASVYAILQTERNVLWVGSSGYGLFRFEIDRSQHPYRALSCRQFSADNGLESNIVYSLALDSDKNVWVGTRGGGLRRFSTDGTEAGTDIDRDIAEATNDITYLLVDSAGELLMGTSMGLYCRNSEGGFRKIESQHLDDTSIHGIIEDRGKTLWVSTNNGLIRINRSLNTVAETRFSAEDGLQSNEFSDGACLRSPYSGLIYFGGISGFSYFNPDETGQSKAFPKLHLKGVYIGNDRCTDCFQEKNGHSEITMSPQNSSFTLKFATLDYTFADRCEIAYNLNGHSKDWVYLGTSKNIAFSSLPHGHYRLDVRHTNADKVWSDEVYSIDINILPHWYETWYAFVLLCLAIGLFGAGVIWSLISRHREQQQLKKQEEEKGKMIDIHEAKLQFFTNIAHEFSNSLTLIYGPCKELQKSGQLSASNRKYLDYIESNSSRMLNLIQQIIAFRRTETGHLKITPEKVSINEIIRRDEEYFKGKLEEKELQIKTAIDSNEIIWTTDKDSIEKIIFNLLSNATKYTPDGGTISLDCTVKNERLKISVTNYGIGIPEEKRSAIFDRFEVLDRFENDIRKGKISNGIGLSMCKNLVELMHGHIWIDSDGKSYTSFCFELPELQTDEAESVADSTTPAAPTVGEESDVQETVHTTGEDSSVALTDNDLPEADETDRPDRKRILIVDDDNDIRNFIRGLLSDKYNVYESTNGREALQAIERNLPDLVISDVIMPVMDGFQLLKTLRENPQYKHIPVILLTSGNSDDSRKTGLERGADAFIGKPFNPDILQSVISNVLGRDEAVMDYSNSSYSAMDRFLGMEISKEDRALFTEITDVISSNIDNDQLCMEFIAEKVSISKMQLYRKFKSCLGITPVDYIKTLRLEKAERLLKTTARTVQQIMYDCGFNSKTYFYKEFAKKYGVTPKQYRDNAKPVLEM